MYSTLMHTETPFINIQEIYFIGNPKTFCKDDINFTCKEILLDLATATELLSLLHIVFPTIHGYKFYHLQPVTINNCTIYEVMLESNRELKIQQDFVEKNLGTIKERVTRSLASAKIWDKIQISFLLQYLRSNHTKVIQLESRGTIAKEVRSSLWNGASEALREKECFCLPHQCEIKWKNLKAAYIKKDQILWCRLEVEEILGRSKYRQNSIESEVSDLDSPFPDQTSNSNACLIVGSPESILVENSADDVMEY
ncbi:7309_t:CDS:2 [Funneliformis caledonium]|uniref:7309_t:CDS:1 n=1 Tax=Funneliformis caledonium TaxID=1117310 RepID=A0A9N8ZXJ8_9GLOM|nr:7309_t:CDS:2 [Funneliformis caledonium]